MSDLVGDARAWSPDAQEAVRLLAVSALVEGRDRVEVAALFKVSARAVDNWWAKWQAGGWDALLSRPRGRRVGEHQVLSEAEHLVHPDRLTTRPHDQRFPAAGLPLRPPDVDRLQRHPEHRRHVLTVPPRHQRGHRPQPQGLLRRRRQMPRVPHQIAHTLPTTQNPNRF